MMGEAVGGLPRAAGTVVLGAGPAGSVLAARLAEAGEDVLLLEAGPDYGPPDSGRWPERLLDPTLMPVEEHSWGYISACQHGTPDLALQRARVIGGCSSHNGCAAIWGHRADYDTWAVENPGWSAADVEPLFRKVEARLRVHTPPREEITPFHQAVLEAAAEAGYPFIADLSSLDPEFGFAIGPVNIDPATRVRWNGSFAYLDPLRGLPNLRIAGDTLGDRVRLDGRRVTGIDVMGPGGPAQIATERVILAAGAYGSPLILLRSGIGAADGTRELRDCRNARAAGSRAQLAGPPGDRGSLCGAGGDDRSAGGVHRRGRVAAGGGDDRAGPLEPLRGTVRSASLPDRVAAVWGKGWRFHLSTAVMAPRSRGTIRLNPTAPSDPEAAPVIDTNYLADPGDYDLDALSDGFALCRELGAQPTLAALFEREITPGPAVQTREQIRAWVLGHASHDYHPGPARRSRAGWAGAPRWRRRSSCRRARRRAPRHSSRHDEAGLALAGRIHHAAVWRVGWRGGVAS